MSFLKERAYYRSSEDDLADVGKDVGQSRPLFVVHDAIVTLPKIGCQGRVSSRNGSVRGCLKVDFNGVL